jgi:serine/threonine protein kinase
MDARYEPFCFADPVFYDAPERWQRTAPGFALAEAPAPEGWNRAEHGMWIVFQPQDRLLPSQGWKIHVSATPDNAERVLDKVFDYCFSRRVTFKCLHGPAVLLMQNSKYAARGSSGKLLTLYPVDEAELERTLTELDAIIGGEPGPYVLSDLRWNAGPLYTRYGAFAELYHIGETGSRDLAMRTPDGRTVTDRRGPVFSVPDWVKLPACLEPQLAARGAQRFELPYQIESALHFSNGGGIYLAQPKDPAVAGGGKVVLKEARPYSGLDQGGIDAVARLRHEQEILESLRGLDCVPQVIDYQVAWEHHFLIETFVDGATVNATFVRDYPLVHPGADLQQRADYAAWAVATADRVEAALGEIHGRGIVFGDLHPNNLMLRPDGSVVFFDFELASPVEDYRPPLLGAGGFAAPRSLRGFDVDLYALAALRLWLFMPLVAMLHLDPAKAEHLMRAAHQQFPLPPDYFDVAREWLAKTPGSVSAQTAGSVGSQPAVATATAIRRTHPAALLDPDAPHDWSALRSSLAKGIHAAATPSRADRLFPGDISQFNHGGHGHGLAYGAAGVLYALQVSGAQVDPAHVDWLVEASRRDGVSAGALTGTHGTAYALDVLGRRDEALALLDRLNDGKLTSAGIDDGMFHLAEGLAGIGLVDLHFARATGDSAWLDSALRAADRLATQLPGLRQRESERIGDAKQGLAYGAAGAALLAVRLYEETKDAALLDLADQALRRDLDACRNMADGTVQVADGDRVLPYLEIGSTGIGLVLREYLAHRPDSPLAALEAGIARCCDVEFTIQSGLFNGRASFVAYLTRLRDARAAGAAPELNGLDAEALLERQVRRLLWHAVSYQGSVAFPGDQLLRLSMDLASGSAGVLLALNAAIGSGPGLPFLAAARHTTDTTSTGITGITGDAPLATAGQP